MVVVVSGGASSSPSAGISPRSGAMPRGGEDQSSQKKGPLMRFLPWGRAVDDGVVKLLDLIALLDYLTLAGGIPTLSQPLQSCSLKVNCTAGVASLDVSALLGALPLASVCCLHSLEVIHCVGNGDGCVNGST